MKYESAKRAIKKYKDKHAHYYTLCAYDTCDVDVIEKIAQEKEKSTVSGYLKSLVRADIKKDGG